MGRRRKSNSTGCGYAVLAFIILLIAGPLAPLIAIILGIVAVVYVIKKLSPSPTHPQPNRPATVPNPAQQTQLQQFNFEYHALQKKMGRPGQWKTQVERIREAALLKARLVRAASQRGANAHLFTPLLNSVSQIIDVSAEHIIPYVNRHFIEQTEKLQAQTSHARIVKSGNLLLDQLKDIAAIDPAFANMAATLALPLKELTSTAHQASTLKARTTAAQAAERAGRRDEAIAEYLNLLYELKTDNIDDDDQANEIADLEDRVRRVVLSYANVPKLSGKTITAKTKTRRLPKS